MVTTRNNHDNQQANHEGNSSAMVAEMRRELEMMQKLREEDRLQQEEERLGEGGIFEGIHGKVRPGHPKHPWTPTGGGDGLFDHCA